MDEWKTPPKVIYDETPTSATCLAWQWKPSPSKVDVKERVKKLFRQLYIRASLLGLPRERPPIPEAPKAVIVATGGNLGGAILSLPLIEAARNRWPSAHLAVVSNTERGAAIVKFAGLGDSHHVIPNVTLIRSFFHSRFRSLKGDLRKLGAEVIITNHNLSLVHLLASLRVSLRIGHVGYSPDIGRLLWDDIFNIQVPSTTGMNWLASYADLVHSFDGEFPGAPKIKVDSELRHQAALRLQDAGLAAGQRAVAVQAGVWEPQSFKQWPISLLAEACSDLWQARELAPVVIGALGEESTASVIQNAMPGAKVINLVGNTTPGEAAALLSVCSATIANDSGLMHLSAAVGTPTVAIFGMADHRRPWCYGGDTRHRIIRRRDCRPCYELDKELLDACRDRPCLNGLKPEIVVKAVLDVIDNSSFAQPPLS